MPDSDDIWVRIMRFPPFADERTGEIRCNPIVGFDCIRSDLFRYNPVRNPTSKIPTLSGPDPVGLLVEITAFRTNPTPVPNLSGRIHRQD
jgi:hypothetical protein